VDKIDILSKVHSLQTAFSVILPTGIIRVSFFIRTSKLRAQETPYFFDQEFGYCPLIGIVILSILLLNFNVRNSYSKIQ